MTAGAIIVIIGVAFWSLYQLYFKILPNAIRQLRERRLIRRYGKERYLEMKFKAELDACKKDPAAEARIKKADSFIKRAVFGQVDDSDSGK